MTRKKIFIVAELSANHNNDFNLATKTIKAMAKSGADAVKVQTYTADSLSLDIDNRYFGPKKEGLWKGWKPYELYKEAAMPWEWQPKLKRIAQNLGLEFFSSPFDSNAVDFLEKMNVRFYKLASFEINDIPLIKKIAKTKKPIIISTGVADIGDIELAIKTCRDVGNNKITLLKCTSNYPATIEKANLLTIPDMQKRFNVEIGVSDHTMGSLIPVVAASLGATVVEKHFILDRELGGPDSSFSMEPDEFKKMVEEVRLVEKSLGKINYKVTKKDRLRRRSLFAIRDIKIGENITKDNIKSVRPGNGLAPKYYEKIIGKKALKNIKKGSPIKLNLIKK